MSGSDPSTEHREPRTRGTLSSGIWMVLLVGFCALSIACVSCSSKDDRSEWFSRAEAASTKADRLLSSGDTAGAREVLRRAVEANAARAMSPADVKAVQQDMLYRLAQIDLESKDAQQAAAWATEGLELGRGTDAFTTNLLIVRGRAYEQLRDPVAASRDYHDALVVTEALLDRTLGDKTP